MNDDELGKDIAKTLDNITATLKSGGRFNVQTRNQLKDLASKKIQQVKSAVVGASEAE